MCFLMVFVFCSIDLLAELDRGIIREAQIWHTSSASACDYVVQDSRRILPAQRLNRKLLQAVELATVPLSGIPNLTSCTSHILAD